MDGLAGRGLTIRAPVAKGRHALMAGVEAHERDIFTRLSAGELHKLKRILTKFRHIVG